MWTSPARRASTLLLGLALTLGSLVVGSPAQAGDPVASDPATAVPVAVPRTADARAVVPKRIRIKERRVLRIVNNRRAKHGCTPLKVRKPLVRAARRHSRLMAKHRTMSHQLPGEESLGSRFTAAGYRNWTSIAENVAFQYRAPKGVVRAWMRSSGHRKNILNCAFRHTGVGLTVARGVHWWTQDFGRK